MNGSGDFLENPDEQQAETFARIVETLSTEVTVQLWVLLCLGLVIGMTLFG